LKVKLEIPKDLGFLNVGEDPKNVVHAEMVTVLAILGAVPDLCTMSPVGLDFCFEADSPVIRRELSASGMFSKSTANYDLLVRMRLTNELANQIANLEKRFKERTILQAAGNVPEGGVEPILPNLYGAAYGLIVMRVLESMGLDPEPAMVNSSVPRFNLLTRGKDRAKIEKLFRGTWESFILYASFDPSEETLSKLEDWAKLSVLPSRLGLDGLLTVNGQSLDLREQAALLSSDHLAGLVSEAWLPYIGNLEHMVQVLVGGLDFGWWGIRKFSCKVVGAEFGERN